MQVEFKLFALEVSTSELDGDEPVPRYEEVLSFAEVERVNHVADSCVLVKEHVFLHTSVSGIDQLILHGVDCLHQAVFKEVL